MEYPILNKVTLQQMIEFHESQLRIWKQFEVSCGSCEHFIENGKHCKKYNATVPDDVITVGCNDWQHDPIPF